MLWLIFFFWTFLINFGGLGQRKNVEWDSFIEQRWNEKSFDLFQQNKRFGTLLFVLGILRFLSLLFASIHFRLFKSCSYFGLLLRMWTVKFLCRKLCWGLLKLWMLRIIFWIYENFNDRFKAFNFVISLKTWNTWNLHKSFSKVSKVLKVSKLKLSSFA